MNVYHKIAFIAPDKALFDQAQTLQNEYGFLIYLGDLPNCIKITQKAMEDGAEVIISRGGTATLIRQQLGVPLVELSLSSYDVLYTLNQAKKIGTNIGVIGFSNLINGISELNELLDINITSYIIHSKKDIEILLEKAVSDQIEVIIGGALAVRKGKELGIPGFLITSGQEAILSAVEEARRFIESTKEQRDKIEEIRTIFAFIHDGIVTIDKDGIITNLNKRASEFYGIDSYSSIGMLAVDAIPNFQLSNVLYTGNKEIGRIQKIKEKYVAENHIPIIVKGEVIGAVCTIQDVTEIQKTEEKARKEIFRKGLQAKIRLSDVIAVSDKMKVVIREAELYGKVDSTVFIRGESGTGKELIAQGIHNISNRRNGPFVAVNCATFTESLLESELFGYIEGAFTGAKKGGKPGLFELAHHGTLFLDEIGEMPYSLQAHLLRVLQEGEIRRIGADYMIPVNVRIITATNVDIEEFILQGKFRADLFYRLNILPLNLPPLRERTEDIPNLVSRFIDESNRRTNYSIHGISKKALDLIKQQKWPGNVRQLKNFIEKMVIISDGPVIQEEDICPHLQIVEFQANEGADDTSLSHFLPENHQSWDNEFLQGTLEEIEIRILNKILEEESGNFSRAAKRLEIHRSTLHRKLKMSQNAPV